MEREYRQSDVYLSRGRLFLVHVDQKRLLQIFDGDVPVSFVILCQTQRLVSFLERGTGIGCEIYIAYAISAVVIPREDRCSDELVDDGIAEVAAILRRDFAPKEK